jgi:asparagine synthase (glutamine-hydrolysing)
VQYTQGAGCESVGAMLAEQNITDDDYERICAESPHASINSKEAAYYYQIFRTHYPHDSALRTVGIWNGFNFPEEREPIKGTV